MKLICEVKDYHLKTLLVNGSTKHFCVVFLMLKVWKVKIKQGQKVMAQKKSQI